MKRLSSTPKNFSYLITCLACIFLLLLQSKAVSFAHMVSSYPHRSSGIVQCTSSFPITVPYYFCPNTPTTNTYFLPFSIQSSVILILATCSVSSAFRMFMSPCEGAPIVFVIGSAVSSARTTSQNVMVYFTYLVCICIIAKYGEFIDNVN